MNDDADADEVNDGDVMMRHCLLMLMMMTMISNDLEI